MGILLIWSVVSAAPTRTLFHAGVPEKDPVFQKDHSAILGAPPPQASCHAIRP